jgi:hypothetical protein
MQIREYIKQANVMMDALNKSGDPVIFSHFSETGCRIKLYIQKITSLFLDFSNKTSMDSIICSILILYTGTT